LLGFFSGLKIWYNSIDSLGFFESERNLKKGE
jgi:hypothetical protein